MCQYTKKTGTDFRNVNFKIFGEFFLNLNLVLVSGTVATELSSWKSYLLSGDDIPECGTCQWPLTVKHILMECVDFNEYETNTLLLLL